MNTGEFYLLLLLMFELNESSGVPLLKSYTLAPLVLKTYVLWVNLDRDLLLSFLGNAL